MLTKFMKLWTVLTNKKFLLAMMGLIAIFAPLTAPFIASQGLVYIQTVQGLGVGFIALGAYLTDSPKQKDEKLKGGSDGE